MNNQAIHHIVQENNLNYLKKHLITNIDVLGAYECTALHYACREGNVEIVDFLIKNGANVNSKNQYATAYPLFEVINSRDIENHFPLIKLLIEHGAHINSVDSFGNTILHHAIEQENINLVDFLLSAGIDVNQTLRYDNDTALHYACFKKNKELFLKLLDSGAERQALNLYNKRAEDYL